MKKLGKWLALSLLLASFLLGAGLFVLQQWIGTDDFRTRAQALAGSALGKEVVLGGLVVDIWPVPAVAVNALQIKTSPQMRLERVELRAVLSGLLAGRLELATLLVRRAEVSQAAVDDLVASLRRTDGVAGRPDSGPDTGAAVYVLPRRLILDAITWRGVDGSATTVDADLLLDGAGGLDRLQLTVLQGRLPGMVARIERKAPGWDVAVDVAGGTIRGSVVGPAAPGAAPAAARSALVFDGRLETRNVELEVLLRRPAGQDRGSPMRGKLMATTTFTTRADGLQGLLAQLRSHSQFSVQHAVLHGVDLARAVKTVGLNRGGETRLDSLTGLVVTQGRTIELRDLNARSGALSAHGNVVVATNRSLSGRVNVNLGAQVVGSAVGVPLVVGGDLDAPEVTLTRSAMLGAAIGTLVMPGVGTGAGAGLGERLSQKLQGLLKK